MKILIKYLCLFSIGGLLYMFLEISFSGSTHWTMGILGGICFILVGLIDTYYDLPLYKQMILGALLITALEFVAGIVLNVYLKLQIWDYSHLPLNILGQISLPFTIIWFFLSLPAILLDDWIKSTFFQDAKTIYKLR